MAASMTTRKNNTDELVLFLEECKRMNLEVLPPDVNTSQEDFAVTKDSEVTFGLTAIKGVGSGAIQNILGERDTGGQFEDLFDLTGRINGRMVNKKVLEALIEAGATDSLNGHRRQQLAVLDQAISFGQQLQREKENGQVSIFGGEESPVELPKPELPEVAEMSVHEQLAKERDLLGLYFSGHPLGRYSREVESLSSVSVADLGSSSDGQTVRIGGLFSSLEKRMTRKGDPMARGRFEDMTGVVACIIFPSAYERLKDIVQENEALLMTGRVQMREEQPEIIVEEVESLEAAAEKLTRGIQIVVDESVGGKELLALESTFRRGPGKAAIRVTFRSDEGDTWSFSSGQYKINPRRDLLDEIEERLGKGSVRLEVAN
jgi:DNA polymerase-3 subunit alpha